MRTQIIPRVEEIIKKRPWIRRKFLPILVLALFLTSLLGAISDSLVNPLVSISTLVSLIAFLLLCAWDEVSLHHGSGNMQFFSDGVLAQRALEDIAMNNTKTTEAYAIHYSSHNLHNTIMVLQQLSSIKRIKIFLQHPAKGINPQQARKILELMQSMALQQNREKVSVAYYSEPASVRGILLKDVAVCIGWYVYEDVPNQKNPDWKEAQTLIWGHNTAAVLVGNDSEAFAPLRDLFLRTMDYLEDAAVPMGDLLSLEGQTRV